MTSKSTKDEQTKLAVRILCIVMAGLLVLSSVAAIFGLLG